MIVVKLQGGLGNQLFQYAIGKALSDQHNCSFFLDHNFLKDRTPVPGLIFREFDLDCFGLSDRIASGEILHFFFEKWPWWTARGVQFGLLKPYVTVKERFFHYDADIIRLKGHLYLDGYWQSPRYFENVSQELRKDFKFTKPLSLPSKELLSKIEISNSVCVNVRRSDFLTNSFHGICSADYFENAMSFIKERLSDPFFFVFTDDIDWCNAQFGNAENTFVVDHQHKGYKFISYLQLMSSCKHFIIPNSSFAWWAVWLANRKDKMVIAPTNWFTDPSYDVSDLIDPSWIRLPN